MIDQKSNGIKIIYNEKYHKEVKLFKNIYNDVFHLINKSWGLVRPDKFNIYIIKSNFKFVMKTSSLMHKIIICTLGLPYWLIKERKMWNKWRGFTTFKNKTINVLLKPMEVYSDISTNDEFLIKVNKKIDFRLTICHEMFHVTSLFLKLPLWLNEGLAMVTVEQYLNKQIVKNETMRMFVDNNYKKIKLVDLTDENKNEYIFNYIKGYWTVRYLEDKYPGFLKEAFQKESGKNIEKKIGKKLGIDNQDEDNLWNQLDDILYNHFKDRL